MHIWGTEIEPTRIRDGATVVIVGGGPAGAFSAMHLLAQARERGRKLQVVIFERNCQPRGTVTAESRGPYAGCPQCAGGISPPLYQALQDLGITLPPDVVQAEISSITVQGCWKSIILPVPRDRKIYSVYRGTLPFGQHRQACFDAMLLGVAMDCGAQLIGGRVFRANYSADGRVELAYMLNGLEQELSADFVVFACGVNDKPEKGSSLPGAVELLQQLQPAYVPPPLRKALIFELEMLGDSAQSFADELHYIESTSGRLQLEMCSMLSKRGYITVTLIGKSVDACINHKQNLRVIRDFMDLPRIRRALPPKMQASIRCICNPNLVVGSATMPMGHAVAAVGDMATSRQYKDGILSAHNMAQGLAAAVFAEGVDYNSLQRGYSPIIASFNRDNRYAAIIFFLYRWFFASPTFSRIIYQTFASEKKGKPEHARRFKRIFWAISSGDGAYEDIAWSMLRPATLWSIFVGGVLVTLRNWLAELFFGLDWKGVGRVPTVVSARELEAKRSMLLPSPPHQAFGSGLPEFECIYTVHVRASPDNTLQLLAEFGEENRPYLNPRWVDIRRTQGEPLEAGSIIQYSIFGGLISFAIELQPATRENLLVYKIKDGFAHGGAFVFELQPRPSGDTDLTVYLAFDYARGDSVPAQCYWWLFRHLFPEFVHDVLWNHGLCEFKHMIETTDRVPWGLSA